MCSDYIGYQVTFCFTGKAGMCSDYISYQVTFCFTEEGWHVFRLYRVSGHILHIK